MTSAIDSASSRSTPPSWLPDVHITVAQLASGILEYYQRINSNEPFRLPYPANLQAAFDKMTLLSWHQGVTPPASVMDLLQLAEQPFEEWPITLTGAGVDPEESLLSYGRPNTTCEELGSLSGDVEGEIRETALVRAVMDKARAANAPDSYVAFRRLLIEHPTLTALALDERLATPELALLAGEVRQAYAEVPPEAIADGVVRTCAGCRGLVLPLDDDRTWVCVDATCPRPGKPGPTYPANEGVWWLRRELRTFITGPGRAELRIEQKVKKLGAPIHLWPDFDACDLSVFDERPWVADVKAWRNPIRLANHLKRRLFAVPPDADRAFIVIAHEQVKAQPRYLERLHRECPLVRPGERVVAVSESEFLKEVATRLETQA